MSTSINSKVLFIYDFRIVPEAFEDFQVWASTKGMKYWEKQAGVIRYQTFRKQPNILPPQTSNCLEGDIKHIDVFSQVEVQNANCLEKIIQSQEFQRMQNELMKFIESNSLSHSILQRAYDSMSALDSVTA